MRLVQSYTSLQRSKYHQAEHKELGLEFRVPVKISIMPAKIEVDPLPELGPDLATKRPHYVFDVERGLTLGWQQGTEGSGSGHLRASPRWPHTLRFRRAVLVMHELGDFVVCSC